MATPEMIMAGNRLKEITAGARNAIVSASTSAGTGPPPEVVAAREFYAVLGQMFVPDPDLRIAPIRGGVPCELMRGAIHSDKASRRDDR
jgi:hypothetical protein